MEPSDKEAQLRALLAQTPRDETLRFGLGNLLLQQGRALEAAVELSEAVRLKPDFTAAYLALGKARMKAGDLEGAQAAFEEGIAVAQKSRDEMTEKAMRSLRAHDVNLGPPQPHQPLNSQ